MTAAGVKEGTVTGVVDCEVNRGSGVGVKEGTVTSVFSCVSGTVSGILNCAVSGMDCAKGVDSGSGMKSPIFSVRLAKAAESMVQRSSFLWNWKLIM